MKLYYIDRKTQIKHFTDLSILEGLSPVSEQSLTVPASEDFVIQLAVLPEDEAVIKEIKTPLVCINTDITDKFGKSRKKEIPLKKDNIQPLFLIVSADESKAGKKEDISVKIITDNAEIDFVLHLTFTDEAVENHGYNDISRLSRLSWLNSTSFLNDDIVAPYTEPVIDGKTVKILGRDIVFGENGMPEQVFSYFDEGINLKDNIQKVFSKLPPSLI